MRCEHVIQSASVNAIMNGIPKLRGITWSLQKSLYHAESVSQ